MGFQYIYGRPDNEIAGLRGNFLFNFLKNCQTFSKVCAHHLNSTESHWGGPGPSPAGASPAPPRTPAPKEEVAPGWRRAARVEAHRELRFPPRAYARVFLRPSSPVHVNLGVRRTPGGETCPEQQCARGVPRVPEPGVGAPPTLC